MSLLEWLARIIDGAGQVMWLLVFAALAGLALACGVLWMAMAVGG